LERYQYWSNGNSKFAFVLENSLLIDIRNPNLFVVLRSTLQYSNTPYGLSRHSQLTLTSPTGRGFSSQNKSVLKMRINLFTLRGRFQPVELPGRRVGPYGPEATKITNKA
jgi:hypothetical protein